MSDFCFISQLRGSGRWPYPANECRSWCYTFQGDVQCGLDITDYSIFNQYKLVLVELTPNLIDTVVELKRQTKCYVIGVPESEIVPLWPLPTLKRYKEMLDMCDFVGVINERAIQPMQALTNTRVGFVSLPYPLAWAKEQFKNARKNNLIELGNMNIGVGVPYNLLVFKKLDFNGVYYYSNVPEKKIIEEFGNGRLKRIQPKGYQEYFLEHIHNKLAIHMDIRFTVGRFGLDCAAANIPLVGTYYSQSQGHLFPEISVNHWEIDKAVGLVKRLYFDSIFFDRVVEYANEKLKDFDIEVVKQRLLNQL